MRLKWFGYWPLLIALMDLFFRWWSLRLTGGVLKLVPGFLEIQVMRNRGFFLYSNPDFGTVGIFGFRCLVLILVTVLLFWFLREQPTLKRSVLTLVLLGGSMNMFEGLFRGFVTDYLAVFRFPVVNLADLMIAGGFIHLFLKFNRKSYASHSV